jgi:CRP/FNR family transcriptional regulator
MGVGGYLEEVNTFQLVEGGRLLFSEGSFCSAVPFLKEGELKVYLLTEAGRELTLYRVLPGQFCLIALLSAYAGIEYPAYTRVERDSLIAMLPAEQLLKWIREKDSWHELFLRLLSENFMSVLFLLNRMLSCRVESRLIEYLLTEGKKGYVSKTHEEIAKDIGSVRVVVSRLLKELERVGLLELSRGKVLIKDYKALLKRAESLRP